jgi:hypothetical protein
MQELMIGISNCAEVDTDGKRVTIYYDKNCINPFTEFVEDNFNRYACEQSFG